MKQMRRIILLLTAVMLLLNLFGCSNGTHNESDDAQQSNMPTTVTPGSDGTDATTDSTNKNPNFRMLAIGLENVNESYLVSVQEDGAFSDASAQLNRSEFENLSKKALVKETSTCSDFGYEYGATYQLESGISCDCIITMKPYDKPDYDLHSDDYDTTWKNTREFRVNYYDSILSIGTVKFDEVSFDYYDTMSIKGNEGNFSFTYFPFAGSGEKDGLYFDGNYSQFFLYARTESASDVTIKFNELEQTFYLTSSDPISQIYITTTSRDHDTIETVCDFSLTGTDFKITINDDLTAKVEIVK